jgi:hypothetical protein
LADVRFDKEQTLDPGRVRVRMKVDPAVALRCE